MSGLDDLRNRITDLRSARGARRYYGDTFDDGVQAALDQLEAWTDSLDRPLPGHPDADRGTRLAEQQGASMDHALRMLRRRQGRQRHDDD